MTEYFVRNVKRFCLLKSNRKLYSLSLYYSVQRTLCHSEELRCNDVRIPRKGTILQNPRKILCSAWFFFGDPAGYLYPWGKTIPPQSRWYCLLMCFRIKELWIVICVNFVARGDFRPVCRSTARRLPLSFRSPKNLQEGFRPHTDYTCRWLRVRASTG